MSLSDTHYRETLIDELADINHAFQFAEFGPKLDDVRLVVVASPHYLEKYGPFEKPEDLTRATLIHDVSLGGISGMPMWEDWFRQHGVTRSASNGGIRFNSADHSIDAAEEGAGVLLATELIVIDDLKKGRLVKLFDITMPTRRGMYFVCPDGGEDVGKVRVFREWLQAEIAAMENVD